MAIGLPRFRGHLALPSIPPFGLSRPDATTHDLGQMETGRTLRRSDSYRRMSAFPSSRRELAFELNTALFKCSIECACSRFAEKAEPDLTILIKIENK